MDARWAGNMKTSKEQAEKYTNLLNDIQMMLNDGSMTKDNASKTYDDLKQKYNITTAPPTKPGP